MKPHFACGKEHGQALAGALRVPDDPASTVVFTVLDAGLPGQEAFRCCLNGAELLVAGD